jgi:RNA polymerase sigma-70 factor (ECF subfamily)
MDARARALEELYATRYVQFRNALTTVTGSRDTARDAVQEGFARALATRETYRGDGPLAAWVWKIAVRAALEQRGLDTESTFVDLPVTEITTPERDSALAAAVRELPPRRRLIVFLRYFADFSYEEVAAACGVSEGTVAAALAQARAELRDALTLEGAAR